MASRSRDREIRRRVQEINDILDDNESAETAETPTAATPVPSFPPPGVMQVGPTFSLVGSPISSFYTESGYSFIGFWPNPTTKAILEPSYIAAGYDVSKVLVLSDFLDAFRASEYPHRDPLTSISVATTVGGTVNG